MQNIVNKFTVTTNWRGEIIGADISRYLTVAPWTDVFDKMRNCSSEYMLTFYKRMQKASQNLINAVNVETDHDAAIYVQKVLGTKFIIPPKQATNKETNSKREHSFG